MIDKTMCEVLNTHFLLDFIYFHETIDFSLTSVTSSHVQIWKIVTKIEVGVKAKPCVKFYDEIYDEISPISM
jgi:hypothetical protein